MNEIVVSQFYSFLTSIGIGILIVLIFDVFRIFRKSFKTSDIITFIQDIMFGIIVSIILLLTIFEMNSGEIRVYTFLGILLGGVIYLLTISKFFIKISVIAIVNTKRIIIQILHIIVSPFKIIFKFTRKVFFKPVLFFFINFKKKFTNINEKINYITKKDKVKKGF